MFPICWKIVCVTGGSITSVLQIPDGQVIYSQLPFCMRLVDATGSYSNCDVTEGEEETVDTPTLACISRHLSIHIYIYRHIPTQ